MTELETRPLYAVLDVPADASQDSIKKAYRRLALEHHPDRRGDSQADVETTTAFARIAFAYEVLGHEQRRKRYDLTGEVPQSDSALGRRGLETFLAEYVRAAPKVARAVTNADMSLHSLANYEVLELEGRDVPAYMRGIVMRGLSYLVAVVAQMEEKEVVLLRHYVMDQMYALLAYAPPLDEGAFAERGYIITYYDHPLQSGIRATWSDQNGPENRKEGVSLDEVSHLKVIEAETVEQRKLVALEWHGVQPATAKAEPAEAVVIPGTGLSEGRMQSGIRSLLKGRADLESRTIHEVRRDLESLLSLESNSLDGWGATRIMGLVYEEMANGEVAEGSEGTAAVASANANITESNTRATSTPQASAASQLADAASTNGSGHKGCKVRVMSSGRVGLVVVHDPSDVDMTYKVQFDDGTPADWFRQGDVQLV